MIKICTALILSILFCQMVLVNMFSNSGNEVTDLKNHKDSLSLEIKLLKSNLVEINSLTRLSQQARELGLNTTRVIFEKSPASVARSYGSHSD
jgi:hypothetical protein